MGKQILQWWALLKNLKSLLVKNKILFPLKHQLGSSRSILVVSDSYFFHSEESFGRSHACFGEMQRHRCPSHCMGLTSCRLPCSQGLEGVSSSTSSSSCQCCQHWSVREDFSWPNFEATFWHPQQTNCCLLPPRALWSPNELVSSQEMRKGTHKINLSGYYALSSAKTKTC